MPKRYFAEPYQFIAPEESTWALDWIRHITPVYFPAILNIKTWRFPGVEHLLDSYQKNAGILLCSNHQSGQDPFVLGKLAEASGRWFHFLASHHLFKQSELMGELLRRMGGYSIFRDGPDLVSVKKTVDLLREGRRAVLVFPEGTYFKQNDRVAPLQDGVSLILRQTLRGASRPIRLHAVAIKYWFLEDPMPVLREKWNRLQKEWKVEVDAGEDDVTRLEGVLRQGVKRLLGPAAETLDGSDFHNRTDFDSTLRGILAREFGVEVTSPEATLGAIWQVIRKKRQGLIKELALTSGDSDAEEGVQGKLLELLHWENTLSLSMDYVREKPTVERVWETFSRLEESLTDRESPFPKPVEAVVCIGEGVDMATEARKLGLDPQQEGFTSALRFRMQGLLDTITNQVPPDSPLE